VNTVPQLIARQCEHLLAQDRFAATPLLRDVVAQCRQPLRVLLLGDVSTGKSTLLNALIGRGLADTAYEEKTSGVTWFHGPELAGAEFADPGHSAVEVDFPLAGQIVLGDTPGLNGSSDNPDITKRLLAGSELAGAAAAYLVLVDGESSGGWSEIVSGLGVISAGPLDLVGNIVLVTTKIDKIVDVAAFERRTRALAPTTLRYVGVNQLMAAAVRGGLVGDRVVSAFLRLRDRPDLLARGKLDWRRISEGLPDEDVKALESVVGVPRSLPALLAESVGLTTDAEVAALFERASCIRDLEAVLADLAEDAELFTAVAALHRLSRSRDADLAALLRPALAEITESPAFAVLHRRAAARIVRHTEAGESFSESQRADITLLARTGSCSEPESLRLRCEAVWSDPTVDSRTRQVVALILQLLHRMRLVSAERVE
jgi:hypothetical protein